MLQALEIALILGLIIWQIYVFTANRRLIGRVQAMYPSATQLRVETTQADSSDKSAASDNDKILQGLLSFTWTKYPSQELSVEELGSQLLAITAWNAQEQRWIEIAQANRSELVTGIGIGSIQPVSDLTEPQEYDALTVEDGSPEFVRIVTDTNDYLQANKGAAADFNALRDISEREADLLEQEIEAQISTPLYLGLLGTFAGAIIGLLSLLFIPAQSNSSTTTLAAQSSSFDDGAIHRFLLGILIAMVGSIVGLGLTLLGNQQLKAARATRDRFKNTYYNFLQKALLPKLNSDMERSMGSLKAVLDTFNQDFFTKIQGDFFSKIAEFTPLVGAITENITVQRDFLAKLQTIGYTQLANATIKVFDRVDESAASFEKFLGYQQSLNVAVSKGADTARTITALLDRLGTLENSLNQVPGYLQKHDAFIRDQVSVFTQHTQLLDLMRGGINEALSEDAAKMRQVLDNRLKAFDAEAKTAAEQWNEHFYRLRQDNIYQKIVEYLTPFQKLPAQQQALNNLQEAQARRSAEALQALQQPLEQNRQIQEQLLQQIERTNNVLEKITEPSWFQRVVLGKKSGLATKILSSQTTNSTRR